MKRNRNNALNYTSMNSLIEACPAELGMPAKLIRELVHGKYSVLTAKEVCGVSKKGRGLSMLDEYLDKQGYVFSWGTLSEAWHPSDPDDDKSPPILRFEFMPMELLLAFPQSAQLEDLFMWLYRNHPHYCPKFDCDEGNESWSVISFQSEEGGGEALRTWLVDVFLTLIWHDLLGEATRIVQQKIKAAVAHSPDGSFHELLVEHDRCQLCIDSAELQFEACALLEEG